MNTPSTLRLLASTNNERGDLFTRLAKDLFFALGYDDLRLNVQKSGRELDLEGKHRHEPRRVVAECKAHADKMGGSDLNKFLGVLTRERAKPSSTPVAGYFVSLGGFTEPAVDQENETGDGRVILFDAQRVITELMTSRVVVGVAEAAERAGQCAHHAGLRDAVLDGAELLGHDCGYIWAVYYTRGKQRPHFALVHADGTPLAEAISREVVDLDRLCVGTLHALRYLAPAAPSPDHAAVEESAVARYKHWVAEECGFIHLDGLPADTDLSVTRLKLERLFVPLKATFVPDPDDEPELKQMLRDDPEFIGEVLGRLPHIAILAMPGGGKSTLVNRLATAYAFPDRRSEISDHLPDRDWLPLILRCRDLRDRAHRPILTLLNDIPDHAGMSAAECAVFRDFIHGRLRGGKVLLLVDGLDEISDEGARQTFANHLRTFLAMFPQVAIVVTSREAGFRLVAGVVAGVCKQLKLAPLDEGDVLDLCERWHVEVVGDSEKVRTEARALAQTIWSNERVRSLAENPLLLTTLLVVKRCVRELPRSRAALYREAIRVLVRTWNIEGYEPLDEGEALAQLSYVACTMMEEGIQRIGQKALLRLLRDARQELEAELQFATISPQKFLERIEYRSSLLIQVGHERIEDDLQPVYEFRHLTFQEYLAARGYVEEQYPGRNSGQSLADVLEKHFADENWREVIPLAAVLAGRKAEDLVKRLAAACACRPTDDRLSYPRESPFASLLRQCIRDEVQVTASTLRVVLHKFAVADDGHTEILRGKFGTLFQEVVENAFLAGGVGSEKYMMPMESIAIYAHFGEWERILSEDVASCLVGILETGNRLERIRAAIVCMRLAFECQQESKRDFVDWDILKGRFQKLVGPLSRMLDPSDLPSAMVASWAFAWLGEHRILVNPLAPEMLLSFYSIWRQFGWDGRTRYCAWALAVQPLLPRDTFDHDVWGDCDLFLRQAVEEETDRLGESSQATFVVGWYRRRPWSDDELAERIAKCHARFGGSWATARDLLENLGDAGRSVLAKWERTQRKS